MTTPAGDADVTARIESDARHTPRQRTAESQFSPGTIIAGRYRISSILGSGGMGEVYRADDIKLDQTVALKFLPARLARDPLLLGRLHDEVRLGRQIAHPNVCRIYDIVDWEGAHFIAMEYVDGEDLSRLLRRIGRLADDKAVDIARGIAAGLMAAHAKGILHRDLKPANVMIDSRGDARIMDFGLALADDEDDGTISGTPAYMAPELINGQQATAQSDLYALGLVMFELFTGKRVNSGRTLPERMRELASDITTPSSHVRNLDPAVERVILRCLASDPGQRPQSAREVIHSLPGGDPLAAAMAAGEIPSPRVVAAAGSEGTLRPRVAWALLGAIVVLIALLMWRVIDSHATQLVGMTKPPEVQEARAVELLRRMGVPEQRFRSSGFEEKNAYAAWIFLQDKSPNKWQRLGRGLPYVTFWLREGAEPLLDSGPRATPQPTRTRPPQVAPGASTIELDRHGRLFSLRVIATDAWKPRPLDWNALLADAGFSASALTRTEPAEVPLSFADARAAWTGRHPEDGTPIRIEAAAFRGAPVFFHITAPWDATDLRGKVPFSEGSGFSIFLSAMFAVAFVVGTILTWRNLRLRRGDRQAAIRIALAMFVLNTIGVGLLADHEAVLGHEIAILIATTSSALFTAVVFGLLYIAVEPYVRRRWPDRLISWARLVAGKWRDPMIGRDVLIGMTGGLLHTVAAAWSDKIVELITGKTATPFSGALSLLGTPLAGFSHVATSIVTGVIFALVTMAVLVLLTIVLRRRSFATAGFAALLFAGYLMASTDIIFMSSFVIIVAAYTIVVTRYGLLAAAAMQLTFEITFRHPHPDAFAWYTLRGIVPLVLLLALMVWAFVTALGGQKAFANVLDE
ncbi:MAG TPA: serine/threonine-protein kinase [Thermoanaerobaculia bacterium]|jgi:serine/threonine-protein kinase|nr:serine/threonine-protein kinase [Thermoanaerobaculia bacterium]